MRSKEEKIAYLKDLCEETYLKDIIEHNHVRKQEELADTFDVVASMIGTPVNSLKIANTFQSVTHKKITDDTVSNFIAYFEDIGVRNARLNFRQMEEPHIMENIIYTELLRRGCEVDVGLVEIVERVNGKSEHKRLEIDFVANRGSERYYIQSAYSMPDENKIRQEERPLLKVPDSFKKIIVVKEPVLMWHNDNGTTIISLQEFLLNEDSLRL